MIIFTVLNNYSRSLEELADNDDGEDSSPIGSSSDEFWQIDYHAGAAAGRMVDREPTLMPRDEIADDRQSQPGTARRPRA